MQELMDQGVLTPDLAFDLGCLHKKKSELSEAEKHFRAGADLSDKRCLKELAILLEKQKRIAEALDICAQLLQQAYYDPNLKNPYLEDAQKRLQRLRQKLSKDKEIQALKQRQSLSP